MEGVIITQLSVSEIRAIVTEAVEAQFLKNQSQVAKTEDSDKFLNLLEACKFLQLAKPTLYKYTSKNIVPHIKRARRLFFEKSELLKWLREGKRTSVAELCKRENFFELNTKKKGKQVILKTN